jgi:NmrA-like family
MPGFYMSNIPGGMFRQLPPLNAWTFSLPIPVTSQIPLLDAVRDTGKFVKGMVLNKDKVLGKNVLGATSYVTCGEIVDTFKKLFPEAGKMAKYFELPHDLFRDMQKQRGMPDFVAEELLENMLLMNEFGYYFGESLDWSHTLVTDHLTTWEEYAKSANAWAELN